MVDVQDLGHEIAENAADLAREVTVRWVELAQREPWLDHLTRIRQDNLPNLIRALARAALIDPESDDAAAGLIEEARRHGRSRKRDGYDDSVLPAEYVLLRRSLRHILIQRRDRSPSVILPTVARLELGMGLAETAALHGYHADREADRQRDDDRLLQEWGGLFHEVLD